MLDLSLQSMRCELVGKWTAGKRISEAILPQPVLLTVSRK